MYTASDFAVCEIKVSPNRFGVPSQRISAGKPPCHAVFFSCKCVNWLIHMKNRRHTSLLDASCLLFFVCNMGVFENEILYIVKFDLLREMGNIGI